MGDYFCGLFCGGHEYETKKQLQTVDLKVRMDCEGCELKEEWTEKAAYKVVRKVVQSTGKKAEMWPYVPYSLVSHPFGAQTYDKKAPPGFVRNVEVITVSSLPVRQSDLLTNLFSDDNPNACTIM
ncbi:heavy metal-associated isoprenylated plant protein 20-like [Canna indica]|uniref:Heavy metal-associated isoprenylated plant protein 20-like n=1 Tax=Canna indica TaxID=4628 RepID=A0AAQ3Q2Q7_9LILI|nr:heavy metal-associated isoprenylated plant protein 20-like [Canna indica]